jgi:xanthine/CO dehydrogenase XdhC/CoxF family maturation factor
VAFLCGGHVKLVLPPVGPLSARIVHIAEAERERERETATLQMELAHGRRAVNRETGTMTGTDKEKNETRKTGRREGTKKERK